MKRLVFFGAGSISQAVIDGLIESGYSKENISYVDRNKSNSLKLNKQKIKKYSTEDAKYSDIFVLAVKPKDALAAYAEICSFVKKPKIVSLVAGLKSKKYLSQSSNVELMRVMPNTSSRFNKGITAIYNISASESTQKKVALVFKKVGMILDIQKESHMDDFTGLVGSGPAYFFYLLQVYEKRIMKISNGDPEKKNLVISNLLDGVSKSIGSGETTEALIKAVASKKGTTEAGIKSFQSSQLLKSFDKGIAAAIKRSKEISSEF
jgi:pyrroline-5-carboxylate reductase